MSENKAHLLLVDDDKRILSLLSAYLSKKNFMVSSARNSTEARSLLNYFEFDLLIIDIMMPGENGLELLENIRKKTNVPAIFLSAKGEPKDKISGLEIGADDYLTKPFEPEKLLDIIERATKRSAKLIVAFEFISGCTMRLTKLTDKELEVMKYIVKGNTNKEISETLKNSTRTIELHRSRIFEKMGVSSATELATLTERYDNLTNKR